MDIDLDQLRELMRAVEDHGITELEIEKGEERIALRRGPNGVVAHPASIAPPAPVMVAAAAVPGAPAVPAAAPAEEEEDENTVFVTSPFVGTFYRSPAPSADPFVAEGDSISPGKVLCIVEAMKLMNEIESEISGTVEKILVENGKPVEYGDRLFKVRKA